MTDTDGLRQFDGEHYLSLTTYRRDGTPVSTPVWFVADAGRLFVYTADGTGKVKRIRHTAGVRVEPCDRRGRVHGQARGATARLLPEERDVSRIERLMTGKYGRLFRLFRGARSLRRRLGRGEPRIGIELTV